MAENQVLRKLVRLESYLTNNYHISPGEAVRINRYIRREFIDPRRAIRQYRESIRDKIIVFPVQKSYKRKS